MILFFDFDLAPEMDHDLIATKEIVSETSHDLILNLYLGIAPRARSWFQNMLRDISFVDHSLSLIISKQRFLAHLPPYTYLGSTTLLFVVRLLSRMLRTLWIQNPAFVEQCILQRPFFSVPGHPIGCKSRIGISQKFGARRFCILRSFFSSHYASGTFSMSSAKIYV